MRRRFRFALERLLRVREIEEGIARASWSAAERRAREAELGCEQLRAEVDAAQEHLGRPHGLAPGEVLLAHRALESLWRGLRSRREQALTLRSQAERLAADHRARQVDVRACEKLRERARERHRVALARAENAELDEVALARARPAGDPAAARRGEGSAPASSASLPMTPPPDPRPR